MAPRRTHQREAVDSRKPDFGIFLGIVGALLAVFIPILQSNGVEMNWEFSAIAYFVIMLICLWSFLTHAVPHWKMFGRAIGSACIIAAIAWIGQYATRLQYNREIIEALKKPENANQVSKQIRWLLPEIDMNNPYVVQFGGHYSKNGEFGGPMIYGGSRSKIDSVEMNRKHGATVVIGDGQNGKWPAMTARTVGRKVCIEVHVPTLKAPIDIENGESGPLPEGWEWNSDATAMEIVDDQRRVIFQEEFIPENQVILRGYIQFENTTLVAYKDGWPSEVPRLLIGTSDLRPMFLYPSNGQYQGKRNPNYAP